MVDREKVLPHMPHRNGRSPKRISERIGNEEADSNIMVGFVCFQGLEILCEVSREETG